MVRRAVTAAASSNLTPDAAGKGCLCMVQFARQSNRA